MFHPVRVFVSCVPAQQLADKALAYVPACFYNADAKFITIDVDPVRTVPTRWAVTPDPHAFAEG
jgi:hypothetical protein